MPQDGRGWTVWPQQGGSSLFPPGEGTPTSNVAAEQSLYFPPTPNAAFNLLKILFPDTKRNHATVETTSKKLFMDTRKSFTFLSLESHIFLMHKEQTV